MQVNRYIRPGKGDGIFNVIVQWLSRRGISLAGSRVLLVRGRKTGEIRSTPVNLMTIDGQRYLVAPRGQTQWVRNLRAAGEGQLRLGHKTVTFTPVELADDEKPAILRTYLRKWKWEVGRFFEGVDENASDDVLRELAPGFPVFRITGTA